MAKAVAKSKKAAAKSVAKSKPSARPKAVAAAPSARKALNKVPAKPVAKVAAKKAPVRTPVAEAVKSGKWVYTFGDGKAEGKAGLRDLLGGKGANLAEMANLGLPVPPGFTIPTSVCTYFYAHDKSYPPALKAARSHGCVRDARPQGRDAAAHVHRGSERSRSAVARLR